MPTDDTIVAIATPPGRGGIGVVRLSGERALEIATSLIELPKLPAETQRATLGQFVDPESGRTLDEVVVTCFRRPHSYTGEDVVEISCHGSPVLLGYLVESCLAGGARTAEPGEFTMRAFLNGRVDLTQAEAIRDLIESRTLYQARVAAQQMEGAVSSRLKPHKQALVELIAILEAGIDFAEDDIPVASWESIANRIEAIEVDLNRWVEGYEYGRVVRQGLSLAIVGRPNVGKSSLFNRLLNEERAIVTATPGTTRDLVAETASLGGIPLRFVDTAGVREALEEAEAAGVQKTFQAIADSDLRLLVVDTACGWTEQDTQLLRKIRPLGALLIACNKSDLPSRLTQAELERIMGEDEVAEVVASPLNLPSNVERARQAVCEAVSRLRSPVKVNGNRLSVVWTSALTGEGIADLKQEIVALAAPARDLGAEGDFITNLRHQQLIKDSVAALTRARRAAETNVPHEMLLLDLYDALRCLDAITGATTTDDLLGVIFSTFCVGK